MATKMVRLCDILPNPWRRMEEYPIDRAKVEKLKESIEATTWWDNIVCRPAGDGKVEQAYGHHRIVALRDVKKPNEEVGVIVRDLDDQQMFEIMARENSEEYEHNSAVDRETVRACVQGVADGRIKLEKVSAKASKDHVRCAPSFIQGNPLFPGREHPYTAATLAKVLGWKEAKVQGVLQALEAIERQALPEATLEGLKPKQAEVTVREASKAERVTKAEAKAQGKSDTEAEREAKAAARKVAGAVSAEFKKENKDNKISVHTAGSVTKSIIGDARKKRNLPKLNRFADIVSQQVDKRLTGSDTLKVKIAAILESVEDLDPFYRKQLVKSLRGLEARAGKLAEAMETQAQADRFVQRYLEG